LKKRYGEVHKTPQQVFFSGLATKKPKASTPDLDVRLMEARKVGIGYVQLAAKFGRTRSWLKDRYVEVNTT